MNLTVLALLFLLAQDPADQSPRAEAAITQAFDFQTETDFVAEATGEGAERKGVGAKLQDGELVVLEPWWKLGTTVGFPAPTPEGARVLEASWTLQMSPGSEGVGFVWLDTAQHGSEGAAPALDDWEAPSFAGSLGIGFDASDPWTQEPFRGSGNIHQRPEHEISLHWDGMERFKKLTETNFYDEEVRAVQLRVEWVPGGAYVDLQLGEEVVFDAYFLAGATPYAGRAAFGGRNSETAGWASVDDLELQLFDRFDAATLGFPAPLEVVAIDRALNDANQHRNEAVATFPTDTSSFARILCTLRLDKPETRFDPWDRIAHVFVDDEKLGQVEVLRYITPYHKGHVWTLDVTDFRSILTGERRVEQLCATYGEGWVVSVSFAFYPYPEGAAHTPVAYRLERLWEGKCDIGDPALPPSRFFQPREVATDPETVAAKVRTVVTGHGMSPNTDNAAEFMPLGRTLVVNGVAHQNELWKTDNYLNPCRPQGGTWKYDRAGWAPGDVVAPWEVEVPGPFGEEPLTVGYALDPYVNENRGQTWNPFHQVAGYLVLYREAE
ncbi:MAG: hypothetical protein H8D72_02085 [Planctomycetes bacterium]|nr:hypothetical protein [Planctomycetota bacterium]